MTVQRHIQGHELLLGGTGTKLVDEDLIGGFEIFQEFAAQEFQPGGFLFAHQPDAALSLINEGMIHKTELLLVDHILLAGCALEPRIDIVNLTQTLESVVDAADQVAHERAGEAEQTERFGVTAALKEAEFAVFTK